MLSPNVPEMRGFSCLGAALASGLVGLACATQPEIGVEIGLASVRSVEAVVMDSIPKNVLVIVRGRLPNACTRLGRPRRERFAGRFEYTLPIRRDPTEPCAQAIQEFETSFRIAAHDLEERLYRVSVNGVKDDFSILIEPGTEDFYRDEGLGEFDPP